MFAQARHLRARHLSHRAHGVQGPTYILIHIFVCQLAGAAAACDEPTPLDRTTPPALTTPRHTPDPCLISRTPALPAPPLFRCHQGARARCGIPQRATRTSAAVAIAPPSSARPLTRRSSNFGCAPNVPPPSSRRPAGRHLLFGSPRSASWPHLGTSVRRAYRSPLPKHRPPAPLTHTRPPSHCSAPRVLHLTASACHAHLRLLSPFQPPSQRLTPQCVLHLSSPACHVHISQPLFAPTSHLYTA